MTTAFIIAAAAIALALALAAASSVQAQPPAQDATGSIYGTEYGWPVVRVSLVRANRDGSRAEFPFGLYYGKVGGTAWDIDVAKMYFSVSGKRASGDSRAEIHGPTWTRRVLDPGSGAA